MAVTPVYLLLDNMGAIWLSIITVLKIWFINEIQSLVADLISFPFMAILI